MTLRSVAEAALRDFSEPRFSTEELAEMANVKTVTIRAWLTRGHLRLKGGKPGRGRALFFSIYDSLQVIAFSQLSALGFPPNKFAGRIANHIVGCIVQHFNVIAEIEGFDDDVKQYIVVMRHLQYSWMDADRKDYPFITEVNSLDEVEYPTGSIYIVVDGLDFAKKVLELFINY